MPDRARVSGRHPVLFLHSQSDEEASNERPTDTVVIADIVYDGYGDRSQFTIV